MKSSSFRVRAVIGLLAMLASVLALASPAGAGLSEKPLDCDFYLETLTPTHEGDAGANIIYGTQGDDIIFGYGGNDRLFGLGGNDIICGGEGNDRVDGGAGSDTLYGGDDVDRVYGRAGDDFMFGNDGNDYMAGANGNDEMHGQAGNDRMFGQNDDDTMYGSTGDDILNGGRQTDTVDGGTPDAGVTETNQCVDTENETNCGTVTGPPIGEPDLVVTSDATFDSTPLIRFPNGFWTVSFTIENVGPIDATNVYGEWATGSNPTLGCHTYGCPGLGTIPAGETLIYRVIYGGSTDFQLPLTLFVSHDVMDANPADNTSTWTLPEPDLVVTSSGTATGSDQWTVELTVANMSLVDATNAVGTITYGAGTYPITDIIIGCAAGTALSGSPGDTCPIGTIPAGDSVTVTFFISTSDPTASVDLFVSHDVMDANPADNTSTFTGIVEFG